MLPRYFFMAAGVSRFTSTPTNNTCGRLPGPEPIASIARAIVFRYTGQISGQVVYPKNKTVSWPSVFSRNGKGSPLKSVKV